MVDTPSIVAARLRYAPTTKSNHYERTTSPPTAHPTDAHKCHERTPRMHRMSKRRMHTTDESDSQGEKVGSRAGSGSSLFKVSSAPWLSGPFDRFLDPLAHPKNGSRTGHIQIRSKGRNGQNACRTTKEWTVIPCGRVQVSTHTTPAQDSCRFVRLE
jgi:hypothetical protein